MTRRTPPCVRSTASTRARVSRVSKVPRCPTSIRTAPTRGRHEMLELLAERQPLSFGIAGWDAIDAEEVTRGAARGRVRTKIVDLESR